MKFNKILNALFAFRFFSAVQLINLIFFFFLNITCKYWNVVGKINFVLIEWEHHLISFKKEVKEIISINILLYYYGQYSLKTSLF